MRPRLVALPVAAALLASLAAALVPSAAQASTVDCTYTSVLPARVVVNKAPKTFRTPVKIGGTVGGSACAKSFSAQEQLTHKSDTYTLAWQYNNRSSSDSIYPVTVKPGIYRTPGGTNCVADTSADMTCAVEPGSTVIKFGGKAHLSGTRLKGKDSNLIRFTARATHYAQYATKYVTTEVAIQRRADGKWHTVHSEVAHGKNGYTWTAKDADTATYRAVSAESSTTFAGVSDALTR